MVGMTDPEGGVYQFGYARGGRRTRSTFPNGMILTTGYDRASRVTSMVYGKRTGEVIESFTCLYDRRGNRTAKMIRHWIKTGHVATGKIINVHIPELYSIVRGKIGKGVEFGLSWGITRLQGGFILATVGTQRSDVQDTKFAVRAAEDLVALFGNAPKSYAYDRAGYSQENIKRLQDIGVRNVGLAPRGRAEWQVDGKIRDKLIRERAQVEGSIGTIKGQKYGFNRPAARSAAMMGVCGQRTALGANLAKLVRGLAKPARAAAAR